MSDLSHEILYGGYNGVLKLLVDDANVNKRDLYGFNPLIQTVIRDDIELTKLLIKHGADVNYPDMAGCTALFWAADKNNYELCKLLLDHNADPNLYTTDGQPIITYPRLRGQKELIKLLVDNGADVTFAKEYINAKLIGHRFELNGKTHIINHRGHFIELSFEGFTPEFTLGLIRESLFKFMTSNRGKRFTDYTSSLNTIIDVLITAANLLPPIYKKKQEVHAKKIEPLLKNQLLIIPVTYHGHAITFVKYFDLLARCDRGVNNFTDTIVIYTVHNPFLFNEDFVKKLLYTHHTDQFLHSEIKEYLALEPLITIPNKAQISGNCSWANVESGVIAALFMLQYKRYNPNKYAAGTLRNKIMNFYYAWIEYDKDRALNECINYFNHSKIMAQKAAKAAMMASILFQRCNADVNREIIRAKKILAIITLEKFKYILKSYVNTYCTSRGKDIGKKFTKLLTTCNFNLTTLELDPTTIAEVNSNYKHYHEMLLRLHKAAVNGNLELIQQLCNKTDVEINSIDNMGSTALIYASWQGHLTVVEYLIEKMGADPNIINDKGGNALQYAKLAKHQDVVDYLEEHMNDSVI